MQPIEESFPEPAERVRSALRRCSRGLLLCGQQVRRELVLAHVDERGRSVVLGVRSGSAPLSVTNGRTHHDGASISVSDEVLGTGPAAGAVRLWAEMAGTLLAPDLPTQRRIARQVADELPDPLLLDVGTGIELVVLRPSSVTLVDGAGVTAIATEDLLTSGPDPFSDIEGLWIEHFGRPECPVIAGLRGVIGGSVADGPLAVTALDRFGLTLRHASSAGGSREIRLGFEESCVTVADLGREMRRLLGLRPVRR